MLTGLTWRIQLTSQVSDALLKLQKLPSGQVARAGHLADIGGFLLFDMTNSVTKNP